jgi:TPR repeat protein
MNNLALMLDKGEGLPRDESEARSLWRQSAALGHVNAMANLGQSDLAISTRMTQQRDRRPDFAVQQRLLHALRCRRWAA